MVLSARAVHPCDPLVLALPPGLPASAFAIVAMVVKVGEQAHLEAHGDVAAARANAWPSVAETVAEERSEVESWEVQTTAFAPACASACGAAAAGEHIGDCEACCWAHFVGCRWLAGEHMRSHSPEGPEDALGDVLGDVLAGVPVDVLAGDLAEVRMDRLAEQPDSTPSASYRCENPVGSQGAVVEYELYGKSCHSVWAAMLRACGVSFDEGNQAVRGNAGASHWAGACRSHPPRPRHQRHH